MAKRTRRKPGLWHGPRRVEIEEVSARHKKRCTQCSDEIPVRRLKIVDGVARSAKTSVLCKSCGVRWLRERASENERAIDYLKRGEGSIRG